MNLEKDQGRETPLPVFKHAEGILFHLVMCMHIFHSRASKEEFIIPNAFPLVASRYSAVSGRLEQWSENPGHL